MSKKLPRITGVFQDKRTGYMKARLDNNKITSLHRYIWRYHNGSIPKGCQIHHDNRNIFDNRIENLICVTIQEHREIHIKMNKGNMSEK